MSDKPTTYWDYINVQQLLSLQGGVEGDESLLSNDEVTFIVVHQIDELWMKLALREIEDVRDLFAKGKVPEQALSEAVRGLRRIALLFKKFGEHFELMETLTTRGYLSFRDKLYPASGFQSGQLREIEILLGLKTSERLALGNEQQSFLEALKSADGHKSPSFLAVEARLVDRPFLSEAIDHWLHRTPIQGSTPDQPQDTENVRTFILQYLDAHQRDLEEPRRRALGFAKNDGERTRLSERYSKELEGARAFLLAEDWPPAERQKRSRIRAAIVFIESFRELPLLAWPREVLDALVILEQSLLIFRQRHARAVERIIGRRTGTGGSSGVDYLDQTASYRIFRDLWGARTVLIQKASLPPLLSKETYGIASGD